MSIKIAVQKALFTQMSDTNKYRFLSLGENTVLFYRYGLTLTSSRSCSVLSFTKKKN